VQRTASQWLRTIFSDSLIYKFSGLKVYSPDDNYIGQGAEKLKNRDPFPENSIVSPLYINYKDFLDIPKPQDYKAIFIMRDPRDVLISFCFSMKYSHVENPFVIKQREILRTMDDSQALSYYIEEAKDSHRCLYYAMLPWYRDSQNNKKVKIFRYEDLIGSDQFQFFYDMFTHFHLEIGEKKIKQLLRQYRFEKLTGRKQGVEDSSKHLRKGVSGDWKNYFTPRHKQAFKDAAGQLLIDLDYEKKPDW